jgi:tetratricopeptide (TPR) repeat protein
LQQNISELNKNAANFLHKDPNLSLTLSKSALSLANKYNDKEAQSESYFNIGMAFYVKGLYARALESHFEARRIAEKLENKKYLGDANIGIGLVYHDEDKTNLSKQYFKESYVNYVQANSEKGIAHSLNMLG